MYLHLGKDVSVETESIVGIFDLDNTSQSHITRKFLSEAQRAGEVINVSDELPKSFVVCAVKGNKSVYLSQLNTSTLLGRSRPGFSMGYDLAGL